jgi:hypothetical protein
MKIKSDHWSIRMFHPRRQFSSRRLTHQSPFSCPFR